jgi:hypothetical protein
MCGFDDSPAAKVAKQVMTEYINPETKRVSVINSTEDKIDIKDKDGKGTATVIRKDKYIDPTIEQAKLDKKLADEAELAKKQQILNAELEAKKKIANDAILKEKADQEAKLAKAKAAQAELDKVNAELLAAKAKLEETQKATMLAAQSSKPSPEQTIKTSPTV